MSPESLHRDDPGTGRSTSLIPPRMRERHSLVVLRRAPAPLSRASFLEGGPESWESATVVERGSHAAPGSSTVAPSRFPGARMEPEQPPASPRRGALLGRSGRVSCSGSTLLSSVCDPCPKQTTRLMLAGTEPSASGERTLAAHCGRSAPTKPASPSTRPQAGGVVRLPEVAGPTAASRAALAAPTRCPPRT